MQLNVNVFLRSVIQALSLPSPISPTSPPHLPTSPTAGPLHTRLHGGISWRLALTLIRYLSPYLIHYLLKT